MRHAGGNIQKEIFKRPRPVTYVCGCLAQSSFVSTDGIVEGQDGERRWDRNLRNGREVEACVEGNRKKMPLDRRGFPGG